MLKVGLTGGIGVGKSTVAGIFESLGVPVFYSDKESKALMFTPEIKEVVVSVFGSESYVNSELNRKYIADQLFLDHLKRNALEKVLYPRLRKEFDKWANEQNAPYVINESALIFEKNLVGYFDKIILVTAPLELRIQRVIKRDQSSEEEIRSRIAAQNHTSENEKLSDFVIKNDNSTNLNSECLSIHNKLT